MKTVCHPGDALIPQGRCLHGGPSHGFAAVHDPRSSGEAKRAGVSRAVELDRAPPRRLAYFGVPPRNAALRQGPPLRLPGGVKTKSSWWRWTETDGSSFFFFINRRMNYCVLVFVCVCC